MKLDLPDDVINKLTLTASELKEILAVSLYQMKKINGVQGGKIINKSEIEFHEIIGKYGQCVKYDENDLLDDFNTIKDI